LNGSALRELTIDTLRSFQVIVPEKEEQTAIATVLSDVDALIASLNAQIAKKRDIKTATMQQLLTGKQRLAGFDGEWAVKRLEDVVDKLVGGGTPSRSNPSFWNGNIYWATVKDFTTFNPCQTQEKITTEGLINSASNLISAGTLIIATRMALGKAIVYSVDVAINQDLKAVFFNSDVSISFMEYWFKNNSQMIEDIGSGSTVKGISLSELKKFPLLIPLLEEQTAIAAVLSDMDAEIAALEQRLGKVKSLKQGMMQELLTGRTRLV
jgi:type I restriction enzyme, S subunit